MLAEGRQRETGLSIPTLNDVEPDDRSGPLSPHARGMSSTSGDPDRAPSVGPDLSFRAPRHPATAAGDLDEGGYCPLLHGQHQRRPCLIILPE